MTTLPTRLHRNQSGLVGKMIVVWLVLVTIMGITAIDVVSIAFTKFRAADLASGAASTAANTWRDTKDEQKACEAARADVAANDAEAQVPKNGCVVNEATGDVTVTVRKEAATLAAARLSWTKEFAKPEAVETSGPTVL